MDLGFVLLSEETAVMSLNTFNWMVFVMVTECGTWGSSGDDYEQYYVWNVTPCILVELY
jgi:hypothetical protein